MKDTPAKGIRGFLIYDPHWQMHVFRVYSKDRKTFTDYRLGAEDIEVELLSNYNCLTHGEIPRVDFAKRKK